MIEGQKTGVGAYTGMPFVCFSMSSESRYDITHKYYVCYHFGRQLNNRAIIVQSLMTHEILLKRKVALDQLGEGLDALGFREVVQAFPAEFRPFFVFNGQKSAPMVEVLHDLLRSPQGSNTPSERATMSYLREYVRTLDENG